MRINKSLLLFFLLCTGLFFVVEFVFDQLFEDQTPFWKILAVSLISGFGLLHPLLKKGHDFEFSDLLKKQRRQVSRSKNIDKDLIKQLKSKLSENGFVLAKKSISANTFSFKTKMSFKTFGERYNLSWHKNEFNIASKGKFYIDFYDLGFAKENVDLIENLIKELD